jgi:asparagine synthase (glutamine-hydrolysing)
MGQRRLSIIDLSDASHQPMVDPESGVVLVFNGEIYNFRKIRGELETFGHRFHSRGDTEVLLRAWLHWGAAALDRLRGMFAFAIWDPRSLELHLVRDHAGMKPLYVAQVDGGIAFASEIKAFLAIPGFAGRLDQRSVLQFLEFGYTFEDRRTCLARVEKLGPGEHWIARDGRITLRQTWFNPPAPDPADARGEVERVMELGEALGQVVAEHLIADVPLGLLLSGGLDSSLVAALAARNGPLTTISMGFGRSTVDERAHARAVAEAIGSDHREVLISPEDVRREIEQGTAVFDDLFADWGTVTTRLLYRSCRELGIKAVLVGEGADELFGGYDIFNTPARLGLWAQFRLYQRYSGRRHGRLFGAFHAIMRDYLAQGAGDAFHAVRLFESRRQLPNNYVMKVDKASMAESVEARAPYLDRRVAEIAWRTPREWLLRDGENKYLLRALARTTGLLPEATAGRVKFGAPLAASWMDDDPGFRKFARDRILARDSVTRSLGLDAPMRAYFDGGRPGYRWPAALSVFRNLAWRLLLLEGWAPHYLGAPRKATDGPLRNAA